MCDDIRSAASPCPGPQNCVGAGIGSGAHATCLRRIASIRSYIQGSLGDRITNVYEDVGPGIYYFNTRYMGKRYRVGVTEEFIEDWDGNENKLFTHMESLRLSEMVPKMGPISSR